jgi:hypothetical protein
MAKDNLKQKKEKLEVLLPHKMNHVEKSLKNSHAGNLMPFDVKVKSVTFD